MSEPARPGPNGSARSPKAGQLPSRRSEPGSPFRPSAVRPVALAELASLLGVDFAGASGETAITGISLNSRTVEPGDLYVALQGAARHGADFVPQAVGRGAAAVLTDEAGARILALDEGTQVPVVVGPEPRRAVGRLAARIYRGQSDDAALRLFAVTGTNGKTTTTYFVNSLLRALGSRPGLIGTIEILAGGAPIPSLLTTPESTDVHALLALMQERGLDSASMEVSSHALQFHRVDAVTFDVAGFTNLTQDHLDLHGTLEDYFATKAELFTPAKARAAVVTVDDAWGRQLAAQATIPVVTLATQVSRTPDTPANHAAQNAADWVVADEKTEGLGTSFTLRGPDGVELSVHCGLPGAFNVSNAALATVMVLTAGAALADVQAALDARNPFILAVPGRMQLVATQPAAVVDFAHNPDALARALEAVRPPAAEGKLIIVFGATGQRDQGKRPGMGAIAARGADIVIVTDDDPHDEDAAAIRADVLAGATRARDEENLDCTILDIFPRAEAIRRAVDLAGPLDTVLVAGRGHEVWQEVKGVNLALDDRVELRAALTARGFNVLHDERIES